MNNGYSFPNKGRGAGGGGGGRELWLCLRARSVNLRGAGKEVRTGGGHMRVVVRALREARCTLVG